MQTVYTVYSKSLNYYVFLKMRIHIRNETEQIQHVIVRRNPSESVRPSGPNQPLFHKNDKPEFLDINTKSTSQFHRKRFTDSETAKKRPPAPFSAAKREGRRWHNNRIVGNISGSLLRDNSIIRDDRWSAANTEKTTAHYNSTRVVFRGRRRKKDAEKNWKRHSAQPDRNFCSGSKNRENSEVENITHTVIDIL